MGHFLKSFERILLLSAPPEILFCGQDANERRLRKSDVEWRQIVENTNDFEPRLRQIATDFIETDLPLSAVVDRVREIGFASSRR